MLRATLLAALLLLVPTPALAWDAELTQTAVAQKPSPVVTVRPTIVPTTRPTSLPTVPPTLVAPATVPPTSVPATAVPATSVPQQQQGGGPGPQPTSFPVPLRAVAQTGVPVATTTSTVPKSISTVPKSISTVPNIEEKPTTPSTATTPTRLPRTGDVPVGVLAVGVAALALGVWLVLSGHRRVL